jgi:putative glutathione S-transferase
VVPVGPDLSGLLTSHGREELGGSPFGDGTPPDPVRHDERPPAGSNPLYT